MLVTTFTPKGVETAADIEKRKEFLRTIGYKLQQSWQILARKESIGGIACKKQGLNPTLLVAPMMLLDEESNPVASGYLVRILHKDRLRAVRPVYPFTNCKQRWMTSSSCL